MPGKAGRSVQTGDQAVLEQLIAAAKSNEPADETVPVTIFCIIYDRDRHIAFLYRMPTLFTMGAAQTILMFGGRRGSFLDNKRIKHFILFYQRYATCFKFTIVISKNINTLSIYRIHDYILFVNELRCKKSYF